MSDMMVWWTAVFMPIYGLQSYQARLEMKVGKEYVFY
jgi:hypothetical protein